MNSAAVPHPVSLKNDGDALVIEWNDGVTHRLAWSMLRDACPCATCRDKRARPPELFPILGASETEPIKPASIKSVGNYAYGIHFSDGHSTGIYSLEYLRELGESTSKR